MQDLHRVRSLISHLDYAELTKSKILPVEKMFTTKSVNSLGGTYPNATLAKKLGPIDYGLFMEEVIELLLDTNDLKSLSSLKKTLPEEVRPYFTESSFECVLGWLRKDFLDKQIALQPQVELTDYKNSIQGHPDLVSFDTVYDIKTTGQFGRMRVQTIFQLLSYYCLAQVNGLGVKNIGLVLPLQLSVVTYDLSKWDWKPFYQKLVESINVKHTRVANITKNMTMSSMFSFTSLLSQFVGSHCQKDDLFERILHGKPLQFFVSGNQTSKISYTKKFLEDIQKANLESTAPIFIHAPYVLNLCHPGCRQGERIGDEKIEKILGMAAWGGWTFLAIKQLLEFGVETGAKGVVVHVGKSLKEDYDAALLTMRDAIIACSQWATAECPLLIETPAGQGTEVLCDPEELAIFFSTLPDFVKEVTGICVDTCHCWTSNYNPQECLAIFEKYQVPVKLIHYNDSKGECGCKKDRHASIGQGTIGLDTLHKVLQYAVENNIPLLTE